MSDVVKTVVNGGIDGAELAANIAITAVEQSVGLASSAGHAVLNVGDRTADTLLGEAKALFAEAMERLRKVANAATEPLP